MAKSTLDSLEKLLVKFLTPIDIKFSTVIKELKKLEEKIEKLENQKQLSFNEVAGSNTPNIVTAQPVINTTTNAGEVRHRTRVAKKLTHTATTPTAAATPPARGAAALAVPPSHSQRTAAPTDALASVPLPAQPRVDADNATNDANKSLNATKKDDWNVVKNKIKRPPRRTIIEGKGSTDDDLRTVDRVRKIHACFFRPETTPESIIAYMNKINPGNYYADKLKLAHSYYLLFVCNYRAVQSIQFFYSAENWPLGTSISEWFRRSVGRARSPSTQASRRRGSARAPSATSFTPENQAEE